MSAPRTPGFVETRTLVFWATLALMVVGAYWNFSYNSDIAGDNGGSLVIPLIAWVLYGFVVGWLIYSLQTFERRPVSAAVAAVAWGFFVAGGIVGFIGEDFQSLLVKLLGVETATEWGSAIRAPFEEETTKLLGVVALALIPRVRLTRTIDGLYYGMLVGLGFLVSENIFFTNEEINLQGGGVASSIFEVMLVRGVFALPLSHVVYTGIAGAGIGYFMSRRGQPILGRLSVAFGLYAAAMLFHGFNNSPILEDVGFGLFIKGIPALVTFLFVLRWARREYRSDLLVLAQSFPEISNEDLETLGSRRSRKQAIKASADPDRIRETQKAQIDLLVAADIYGLEAPETAMASANVPLPGDASPE